MSDQSNPCPAPAPQDEDREQRRAAALRAALVDASREAVDEAAGQLSRWTEALTRAAALEGGDSAILLATAVQVESRVRLAPGGRVVVLSVLDDRGERVADVRTVEIG